MSAVEQDTSVVATRPRPNTSQGAFETLLVLNGEPVELEAHLQRLAKSIKALYGSPLPPGIKRLALERSLGLDPGRLRIGIAPSNGRLLYKLDASSITSAAVFPDDQRRIGLTRVLFPGGLGEHKWRDRSILPTAEPDTLPLLLDLDGSVLEASSANIFTVHGDSLSTPPLDGRILPGVTRASLIDEAVNAGINVVERRLDLCDLVSADELLLTSSIRGIASVSTIDGRAVGKYSHLSRYLRQALASLWGIASPPSLSHTHSTRLWTHGG